MLILHALPVATLLRKAGGASHMRKHFLSESIELDAYLFSIDFNVSNIVLKDSWDVDFRELILAEDNQQAGFATSTISYDDKLLTDGSHSCPEFYTNK